MRKVAVFLVISLYLLAPILSTSTTLETPRSYTSAPLGGTDYPWAMFRHNAQRTGATLASAPSSPTLMWASDIGARVYSSPAVVGGTVYIATADPGTDTGTLYAIDEYSGAVRWTFPTFKGIYSSPAVANGLVYIGSRDSYLYAINSQTGTLVWARSRLSYPITSSPVVADGRVYYSNWCAAGTCNQYSEILSVDAATGSVNWIIQNAQNITSFITSSPTISGDRIFFGQEDGFMVALNRTTGQQLWKEATFANAEVRSAPAVAYGMVFVGTKSRFEAFDELTGSPVWDFNTQGNNATSGAVNNGIVYFGTGKGYVQALNATTGAEAWSYNVGAVVSSSPALALGTNTLVVGANDGYVYALNMTSGAFLWRFQTGSAVSSSPAVADGRVFVGSQDHKVYGIGPIAPSLQASITASETFLKPGEISTLTVTVTNGTDPQSGASLSLTSTAGGGFTTPIEQAPGTYQSNYTAPLLTQQTDTSITVRASKSGYLDDTANTIITLTPFPQLTVEVTPRPSSVTPGSDILLLIRVSNGTEPIPGASVFLSAGGEGSFRDLADGGDGNYTAVYATGLQNSSPTLVIQASKPGFSTGQAQVTVTVSGIPDLNSLRILGIPLFLVMAGLFLLAFVVFVAIVAKRKSEPDDVVPYDVSYVFGPSSSREGLSTRFLRVFSMGLAAIAGS